MRSSYWRNFAEAIGASAIVASLMFVGFQLRQDEQIARAEAIGNFMETTISMTQGNFPYADLIMQANRGEELSEAENYILEQIVNNMAATVQFQSVRVQQFSEVKNRTGELLFAAHLYQNPGLRVAWERSDAKFRANVDPLRTKESLARTYESGSGAFRDRIKSHMSRLDDF